MKPLPPIGTARLDTDGTLHLTLQSDDGTPHGTELRFSPDHPRYRELIDHIGNLAPGEEKPVPLWSVTPTSR